MKIIDPGFEYTKRSKEEKNYFQMTKLYRDQKQATYPLSCQSAVFILIGRTISEHWIMLLAQTGKDENLLN